jgi:hypothetical protein
MPTTRQKKALKELVENGRKPMGQIMTKVGYSPNTSKAPTKLTNSKGWNELLEIHLPDSKLLEKHNAALEANKVISANITYGEANEKTNDFIEVPDEVTRLRAVELGYKVKKRLGPEVVQQFNAGGDMTLEFVDPDGNKVN